MKKLENLLGAKILNRSNQKRVTGGMNWPRPAEETNDPCEKCPGTCFNNYCPG